MDELAIFATDTTKRGVDEMGQALHLFSRRLEELEQDRKAVETDATNAEKAWEREHKELEARLDALATSVAEGRLQAPGISAVAELIDEFAGRLARMEGERETVAELAAQAETWTAELATLEARIDEGLSTLEEHDVRDPAESESSHIRCRRSALRKPRGAHPANRARRAGRRFGPRGAHADGELVGRRASIASGARLGACRPDRDGADAGRNR